MVLTWPSYLFVRNQVYHEYINLLRTRVFMISKRVNRMILKFIIFLKLIKLALYCTVVHLQFRISGRWFAVFYVMCKLLEDVSILYWCVIILTIVFGYSSCIFQWLKIIVFVFEMLISKWDNTSDNTSSSSRKVVMSSKRGLDRQHNLPRLKYIMF